MNARKLILVLCVFALVLPFASISAQEPLIESVCLVTDLGRVNDGTFNQFAHEGAETATDDFDLDYTFIETSSQADYARNIQTCLDEEFDAIVTVGFLIADATYAAAEANPDVYFIGVDQFFGSEAQPPLPNLVGIQYREDQGGFLAGAMAAMMTESGIVAGVYGINIPPVVKFRNGFEQGVAYINEQDGTDVQTLGVYIDNFIAPDRGAAAAEQFIGEGADVIFGAGGPTGSGGISYAAANDTLVIGVDQDEYLSTFGEGETPGAENVITSAIKRVDLGVYDMIEALVNGEGFPESSLYILSAENEGITYAPAHDADVPEEVTARMDEILAGLADGSIETGVDPATGALLSAPEATPEPMVTAEATEAP
jgi:basic membrane lipoprotein Med (substrate-binding protein (PBP1-ABC) superfamily)